MRFLLRPRTLNQALGLLLAGVVAPLLIAALVLLAVQAWQENRLAQARLTALARILVQAVDSELERSRAQLEVLAASPTVDEGDWRKMHGFAQEITRRVPGSLVALVGSDGQVQFNTAAAWGDPLPNLWKLGAQSRQIEWQGRPLPLSSGNLSRDAFERGEPVYSDLYYGVQIHRPAMAVSIPVVRDGQSRHAMIFSYPPALLQDLFRSAVDTPEVRAILVDRRGVVVAANEHSPARVADRVTHPIGMDAAEPFGTYHVRSRDGTTIVGAFAVSQVNGFVVRVAQPASGLFVPSKPGSWAWIALLALAMGTSVLLASLASRRLARPLRELGEDVRAGREPSLRSGIAEIHLLAVALRQGVRAERRRAQEQSARLVSESREAMLRQADRQKDEFLATLAHELRNPLAPIRTAAEVIRHSRVQDPTVERARSVIERQTDHLSRLVDDLLDVSRVTMGRIHLEMQALDLGAVAAAAIESVEVSARERGLVLRSQVESPAPGVRGDATRLTQCLVNLLANAIKFTSSGGLVGLRVFTEEGRAVLEVADTGVGISEANLGRIFDLFVQERRSGMEGNSGLGIGLFLARKIVDLHGGTIEARSAGAGQGSTFRVTLPEVVPADPPASSATEQGGDGAGYRLLVVDDNRDAAEMMAQLLALSDFEVELAHDGESALAALRRQPPDAVLLDIGLPDIDGLEVCRRVRADASLVQPVIVALTGWGQARDRDASLLAGCDEHLTKPVDHHDVLRVLRHHLGARRRGAARQHGGGGPV